MSLTLESLEASVMFFERGQNLLNLLLKFMNGSCLVMIQTHAHIVFLMFGQVSPGIYITPRPTHFLSLSLSLSPNSNHSGDSGDRKPQGRVGSPS
jgi:hypothetical protein